MDNIVVADKQTAAVTQNAWGNLSLKGPGLVQMPVPPGEVATVTRSGQDLIVTLKSGEKVTIGNFFVVDAAGEQSDMVFVGEDGTLWHAQYNAEAFTGFTFEDIASLDELMAGVGVAGSGTNTFAIAALGLLGAGGAAAAIGGGGGGGGGGSSGGSSPNPGDTTAPASPIDLLVSPDGLRLSGRGEAGTTVNIRDAAGNLIGTGTVGADGRFDVTLSPPQTNGQALEVTLTDAAGNTSAPGNTTAPDIDTPPVDTTAPNAPTDLVIAGTGKQLSGRGEVGTTVQVRDADGNLLGSGTVGADGTFQITLDPAVLDGSTLQVTLTDAAGNVSAAGSVVSRDLLAPAQPTDLQLSNGVTLTGKGEPGTTVQVRDASGTLIGSGVVAADGSFSLTLNPPQANGEALDVRLVDAAQNTSAPLQFNAPDTTAPAAVSGLVVGPDRQVLGGRGEPGATVEVRDSNGVLLGSGTVAANGTFLIELSGAVQPGERLNVVQTDASGNASAPLPFDVPLTTTPVSPSDLSIAANGSSLSGTAPPGSRIQVRDANGNVIGSVVVGAEGTFIVVLNPAQANGQLLDVVALDGNGGVSLPVQISAPDITAPAAPSQLVVSADGSQLSGRAEPGSTVRVVGANGVELGTAVVGPTGVFTIALNPAQVDGEALQVTATDAKGNLSAPGSVNAPDLDSPDTTAPNPASGLAISGDGRTVSGRGEPGSTVKVLDAQGNLLAIGTVLADGSFNLQLPAAVTNGSSLQVTLTDAAGNASAPATLLSPDLQAPAQPTNISLSAGETLSGSAEPGARVEVRDANGDLLGSAIVAANGTFTLTLNPPQANGEVLDIRVIDLAGNASTPLAYDAPDITAPTIISGVTVGNGGLTIAGRGEAGAIVEVRDANGALLGTGTVGANGTFLFDLDTPAAAGQAISLVQKDAAGNTSPELDLTVPTTPIPATPSNLNLAADGSSISGSATPGTRIDVRDAQGNVLASTVVGAGGTFTLPLNPAQANGELLDVVAVDGASSSLPAQITAPDITPPGEASDLQISANGVTLTGRGEAGATVEVRNAQGNLLGTALVGANGVFTVTLIPAQTDGQVLDVELRDAAGNESSASATAPDLDGPLQPAQMALDIAGTQLTGVGQAGSLVTVRAADGTVLGSSTVGADGNFSVTLNQPQRNGEKLTVEATDSRGNSAGPVDFTAPDTQAPEPISNEAINGTGSQITGLGEPGATVTVRAADGTVLGSAVVQANGGFTIPLSPAQNNGQALTVEQRDPAGNISTTVPVTAPDGQAPDAPTGLVLAADGSVLSGRGEPGSVVTVTGTGGVILGSATVQGDGSFQVALNPVQLNGQTLTATQKDQAGNISEPDTLTAPDLQAPEAAQGVQLNAGGNLISGQAEPGTTVEVRDPNGVVIGSVLVPANGSFSVPLNPVPVAGQPLSVTVTDLQGQTSPSVPINAIDATAPILPTGVQVNADGTQVSGRGEAGSTVEVRDAAGTVLGSTTVPPSGDFSVILDPAQKDGQGLSVVATDGRNESDVVPVTAPDLTPPALPNGVSVANDGTVTGSAPGATEVIIRDANGIELIRGDVEADGSFSVQLPGSQNNGQPLLLEAVDAATNTSPVLPITAPDTTVPAEATDISVSPDGTSVGGNAEPGSTVIVRDADGNDIGSVVAGPDGSFVVPINPPLASGDSATVVVKDPGGEASTPLAGPDGSEVATPTDLDLSADGFVLTGMGTVGALITVTSAGATLGTATVGSDGIFRVFFSNAQLNAQTLQVNARFGAGKPSVPAIVTAEDTTAPDAPTQLAIDRSGSLLTGRGEVGATVSVVDANGTLLGSATVGSTGLFSISLTPPQANAQLLTVTQSDASNNVSLAATTTAPDLQAPLAASGVSLNSAATVVSGQGEVGANVTVRDASGAVLASGTVNPSGQFQITLPAAQTSGAPLQVTLSDAAGNVSAPASLATPDRTPPAAVTQTVLSADGRQLSGLGEAGASVEVRNSAGTLLGTATVGADGRFSVTFDSPQASGQPIGVTQQDAAGNTSPATSVNTPDLTPPAPLTNLMLNNNGLTLTGLGEPGASVTVRGPDGTIIGSGNVAANGSFTLTLDNAQLNAQRLSVTQSDASNNISAPVAVTAPDLTPPAEPANLLLASNGVQLSGTAEAGSTVTVRDSAGNVLGSVVAASNGTFQVTLNSVQANGQTLQVTATDAAGNVSQPGNFTAPDTTPPAAVANLAVAANGASLAGTGEAGATVAVRAADGTLLGTGTVAADGRFTVNLSPAAIVGSNLSVVQSDASGNASPAETVTAPGSLAPDIPGNLLLAADGLSVTGSGTPGSTVTVYGPGGVVLGTAVVAAGGTFTVALNSVQANGETLQVGAVGTDGSASLPATLQAPDTTAPQPLSELQLASDGLTLTGRGEPGARVSISGPGGVDLGEGVVGADGRFSLQLTAPQRNGEALNASQTDAAGNESNSVSLTAPDLLAPNAPGNLAVTGGGTLLDGTGEAGSKVTVLAADGSVIGSGIVRDDGSFQVSLNPIQANGQSLQVVLTDNAGNQSPAASTTAADITAPDALTALAIASDGATLTGRGEAGATVKVSGPDGAPLGEALVDANGFFTLTLNPALGNAERLSLTQTDLAGNVSAPATLDTPDFTPPAQLTAVTISTDGSMIAGRGEAGATVTVTDANGTLLGTTKVLADGSFEVMLTPAQINQQVLAVQQADPPGNISQPVNVEAPDLTPPEAPAQLQLNADGSQLSGVGEPGSTARVYLGSSQIGTVQVGADGRFVVALNPPQNNGQQLQVTLEDAKGNLSPSIPATAPDTTPPPAVDATINASGTQLKGSGEAGARLTVLNDKGDLVGQGSIAADGTFVLNLSPAQLDGQVLSIVAQDATGNPSPAFAVTAPDLTPPAQPTGLSVNSEGTLLIGTGEPGSFITVRAPDNTVVGSIQVPPGGNFSVPLDPPQNNGQILDVVATDAAGNAALAVTVTAEDTSPPAPVSNLVIDATYSVLSGRGEAGASVIVSQNGVQIGEGTVLANGTFQIELDTLALPGIELSVVQTDAAQNPSLPADYTPPLVPLTAAPLNVALIANGETLTGTSILGASITVYNAAGQVIGEALVVQANGSFSVTLNPPQRNGEVLSVTADAADAGESAPVIVQAGDTTPPAIPVVSALSSNGLVLTGTGEAGATVFVRDTQGNLLGSGLVNAGGAFSINLNAPQLNGQILEVSQRDAALNLSDNVGFIAPDVQAPNPPGNLLVNGLGTQLSGTGEIGATVSVFSATGTPLGTAVVGPNGQFTVNLTATQNDGQVLTVRQADAAGNISGTTTIGAPDTTPPPAPTATINAAGTLVSGAGIAGNKITVLGAGGVVLGSAIVGANGLFVVSLLAAQVDNQALTVNQSDAAGNTSGVALTAPDITPPAIASNLVINADGSVITGRGEPGATVTVRGPSGVVSQPATVNPDGTFTVTLSPAQDNGQALSITLTDPRNNVSAGVALIAPDVDANAPVSASDNLAVATVNLAPVVTTKTFTDSFSTLLSGFSKTFTWTVAAGTTADPTLTLNTSSALALLDGATYTLQVKNAAGAWVTLATGSSQGLLDLILLPLGQGLQVNIGELLAGDYRLTVNSSGIGLLTTVTTSLDVQSTSLTQFTGTGTPTTGNVLSDPGTDGSVDQTGPDNGAVVQVLKNGSYVSAGAATEVQGLYGTLLIRADGSYSYTPNGSPSSVGKVDVFSYQLLHANGLKDTANLYVRIDSPQATEIWNDNNYSAPATVVDAVNDLDSTGISLVNRETSGSANLANLSLPLIGSRSVTSATNTVAVDTTADLQVVLNSSNLLGLLNGTKIELLKLNPATGLYVVEQTVTGGSLVSLLGGGAAYTFQDKGPGSYQIRVSAGGIGLAASIATTINTTTTYTKEFVVSGYTPVSGNLLNDTTGTGSDTLGSSLTVLSVLVAANTYAIPGYNGISVTGTYGTLLVQADGSYSYTLKPGLSAAVIGQQDTFTYELTHPNGTTDTATLTIGLNNAGAFAATSALLAGSDDDAGALFSVAAATAVEGLHGGDGNDHLDGSQGGAISLTGGAGEDTLVIVDQQFTNVDGGSGTDTLLWAGGDASIDLGSLVGRLHDIEVIDLNDSSSVTLSLSLADVVAVTESANDTLLIKGDSNDTVQLSDNWTLSGQQNADGIDYTQYTAQEDPSHHLWVQNGIHVV